jgi:tRNA (Thr-GGU) A37 N-methylase
MPPGRRRRFQHPVSAPPPNPIGLHQVEITAVEGTRVRVRHLEAIDGTPIIDVKPVLKEDIVER